MIIGFFPWQWTDSAILVPDAEGLEYTLSPNRQHYALDGIKTHNTIDDNRMHYTMNEED